MPEEETSFGYVALYFEWDVLTKIVAPIRVVLTIQATEPNCINNTTLSN